MSAKVNVARKEDDIVVGVTGALSEQFRRREAYRYRREGREAKVSDKKSRAKKNKLEAAAMRIDFSK